MTGLRARYCVAGMGPGSEMDTTPDDDPGPDTYLLQLWPAATAPEEMVRQTGETAAYWHREARTAR